MMKDLIHNIVSQEFLISPLNAKCVQIGVYIKFSFPSFNGHLDVD